MHYVNDKNMLYFCCVTQCFSLSLITHKLKLNITDIDVAFSRILRGVIYVGFFYFAKSFDRVELAAAAHAGKLLAKRC